MILIYQSEIVDAGFIKPWASMTWKEKRNAASIVLRNRGDRSNAQNVELNNPATISQLTFVNDFGN